ncbi:MAG: histidine kinase dimerization/phospho-acceptor domain-containing protein, partial [Thermodesulfobacteriota bacterium]|nr:histidine kinase dimerization/phospho-acceptor domain-containing protein [Thermodesulfobacteriota bacterium]
MNRLLERQIKKFLGSAGSIAKESEPLFKAINDAYDSFDTDRDLMERSLDLSSQELIEANRLLRREADSQKAIMDKLKVAITAIGFDSARFLEGLTSENDIIHLTNVLVRLINEHKYAAQEREVLIERLEKNHRLLKEQTQELEGSRRAIKNVAEDLIKSKQVLEKQKQDLEKVNNELDDFTYIVSHDLKEPLRSIDAFSKFIYDDYKEKLEEEGRTHLERIRANAGRMQALIENLLEVSRIERKKNPFEEVQIEELINEAKLRLEYSIKQKNAEIILQDKLPKVFCERVRLTEVFVNLISNAVKFCNKPNPRIEIGLEQKGNFYEFHV